MKTALVISSFVGASHVGACVSAFCLQRLGVRSFMLPTTLFGRHPGWGRPGGTPVNADIIWDMWLGLRAQNEKIDAVLTGYMASPEQVEVAAKIIDNVKTNNPEAKIIVDPVMGDHGKLYVSDLVAQKIITQLTAKASIITPNVWELGYITQRNVSTLPDILGAAKVIDQSSLISSVPSGDNIGALFHNGTSAYLTTHEKFEKVPHGGGDGLAGLFLAHLLSGQSPENAFVKSVSSIFEILSYAAQNDLSELPLIMHQDSLVEASPLKLERQTVD